MSVFASLLLYIDRQYKVFQAELIFIEVSNKATDFQISLLSSSET